MLLSRLILARRYNSSLVKLITDSNTDSPILLYLKEIRKLASEKKKSANLANKNKVRGTVSETPTNYEGVYTRFGWFAIPSGYYAPKITVPELEKVVEAKLISMGQKSLISKITTKYSALITPLPPAILQELQDSVVSKWAEGFDPTGIIRESNVERKERKAKELQEKEYKRQLSTGSRGLRKVTVDGVVAAAIEQMKKEEHVLLKNLLTKHNIFMEEFNHDSKSDPSTNSISVSAEDAAEGVKAVSLTESKALYRLAHAGNVLPELDSAGRTKYLNLKWKQLHHEIKNYYRNIYGRIRAGGYDVYRGKIILEKDKKTRTSEKA